MCGICGFTSSGEEKIRTMVQSLAHRGPDGNGCFVSEHCSLGHARLAILDPSDRSSQPMHSRNNRIVLVFNGEIYNFKELIHTYALECTTSSDTEVIILLYERFGMDFVPLLRGMFAFALYDTETNEVFLVRDSNGIKPLYYAIENNILYFASETRAIATVLRQKPAIDTHGLSLYVRHRYLPRPYTMYEGIFALDRSQILHWQNNAMQKSYFLPHCTSEYIPGTSVHTVLQQSVDAHLISDKPVGLFLSGGLDSTICLYHMSRSYAHTVQTFTAKFEVPNASEDTKFNTDAHYAAKTAQMFGSNHHELHISAADCMQAYQSSTMFLDQPNANPTAVIQYLLAKEAKKSVDVVLSGIGGDELFAGYSHYRLWYIKQKMSYIPAPVLQLVASQFGMPTDVWQKYTEASFIERMRLMPMPPKYQSLVRGSWYQLSLSSSYIQDNLSFCTAHSAVRRIMQYDQFGWLVDEALRLTDASTMGAGLEARTPFIDTNVISYANSQSDRVLLSMQTTKKFLRKAYQGILPDYVTQFSKAGFFSPFAKWIRTDCKALVDETIESEFLAPYFHRDTMAEIAADHHTGRQYALSELTMLIQLHFWCKAMLQ